MKKITIHSLIIGLSVGTLAVCGSANTASKVSRQTPTACSTSWISTNAYSGGTVISYNGVNYTAAYWTQNQDPSSNNGPAGSNKPWLSNGACSDMPQPRQLHD